MRRFALVVLIILVGHVSTRSQPSAVMGDWNGEIRGEVGGQAFTVPVYVGISAPSQDETNPVNIQVNASEQSVGGVTLASFGETITPQTFRRLALQFLAVTLQGTRIRAVMRNEYAGGDNNRFTGPNVEAKLGMNSPDRDVLAIFPTASFRFDSDLEIVLQIDGDSLQGSVTGTGSPVITLHTARDVTYRGEISARRTGARPGAGTQSRRSAAPGSSTTRSPVRSSSRTSLAPLLIAAGILAVIVIVVVAANRN
jgi:hypothetical protein